MKTPQISLIYKATKPNKRGEIPIVLLITYDRMVFRKAVGFALPPDKIKGMELVGNDKLTLIRNIQIRGMVSDIQRKFYTLLEDGTLSKESISAVLAGETQSALCFRQVFDRVQKIYAGTISASRFAGLQSSVIKFDEWSKKKPVEKVTATDLMTYEGYLRTVKKNKNTSVWADFADLKSIAAKGVAHKIIKVDPFAGYKAPAYKNPLRVYLTSAEIERVEAYADDESKHHLLRNVAAWFVLGCYGNMRYSDLAVWDENKMVVGGKVYFSDVKTDTPHYVPIYPKLQRAIERVRGIPKIYTNQVCNRLLKEIMASDDCNIKKIVTTHTARHSFAVNYLDMGGTKDVLQMLMGHKKIQTTAIYGQITDKRIDDETKGVWG